MKKTILSLATVIMFSGSLFSQGLVLTQDDLSAQKRPQGDFTSYESQDGSIYKVGDKITIGFPSSNKTFAFITQGDGFIIPTTQLLASASGQKAEIKRIDVWGTKRTGYYASLRCKGLTGLSNYSVQLESAITVGEVKSFGMTSDEAISELKKAKDKLDLEIITQEEYNKIKEELMNYIKI